MIEDDLSRVNECVTCSIHKLGLGYERCEPKGEISTKFVPSSTYKDEEETLKAKPIHILQTQSHPLTRRKFKGKQPTNLCIILMVFTLACFVVVRATWVSFAFGVKELRGGMLSMLETHIVMSSLISHLVLILVFRLVRTLVLRLALFHVLCLSPIMDLTIAHMVLVHERTALSLDALVTAHVLIVVIVSRVGLIFLLEGPSPTLSRDTWTVHAFLVVVHIPLGQMVSWKGL
jgi:hypothetical protein